MDVAALQRVDHASKVFSYDKPLNTDGDTSELMDLIGGNDADPLDDVDYQVAMDALMAAYPMEVEALKMRIIDNATKADWRNHRP